MDLSIKASGSGPVNNLSKSGAFNLGAKNEKYWHAAWPIGCTYDLLQGGINSGPPIDNE